MIGLGFLFIFALVLVWLLIVQPEIVFCGLIPLAFLIWMAMGFPEP